MGGGGSGTPITRTTDGRVTAVGLMVRLRCSTGNRVRRSSTARRRIAGVDVPVAVKLRHAMWERVRLTHRTDTRIKKKNGSGFLLFPNQTVVPETKQKGYATHRVYTEHVSFYALEADG
jgi:hypothetical protein